LILTLLSSCLKVEPYKTPRNFKPALVIHAYIGEDTISQVWVSESTGITNKSLYLSDANITIETAVSPKQTFNYNGKDFYTSPNGIVKPGDSFLFTCDHPKGNFIVKDIRPHNPKIISVDTQTRLNPFVGATLNFDMVLKDTAALKNYYRLFIEKTFVQYIYDYKNVLIDSFINKKRVSIFGKELAFIQNDYNKYNTEAILFTDATFNGVNEDFSFYISDLLVRTPQERPLSVDLVLENLSRGLYEFYNNRNAHVWQQNSIIQVPSSVQGNLKGFFGVVGAYTTYRKQLYFLNYS